MVYLFAVRNVLSSYHSACYVITIFFLFKLQGIVVGKALILICENNVSMLKSKKYICKLILKQEAC